MQFAAFAKLQNIERIVSDRYLKDWEHMYLHMRSLQVYVPPTLTLMFIYC
jgi:hypothetical protein